MLAQEWLHGQRVDSIVDHLLEKHLRLPTKYDRYSTVAQLGQLAERIVFTNDVPTMLYDMHENKQLTYEGVIKSAKLPYDIFWLEYVTQIGIGHGTLKDVRSASYGALIQRIKHDRVRFIIVSGMNIAGRGNICTISYIIEFDTWPPLVMIGGKPGIQFNVRYSFNDADYGNGELTTDLGNIVNELIFGVFLTTQPRVYTSEQVVYKESHKRARREQNKPPLLEYRRIHIHVHKEHTRYVQRPASSAAMNMTDTDSDAAIIHRRYHKVIGHFRHYLRGDNPHTKWIEPHYRGDPSLGITFTERDVSK